jgi:chemotaxis receptor (MCP) glutamine deamidase CheD
MEVGALDHGTTNQPAQVPLGFVILDELVNIARLTHVMLPKRGNFDVDNSVGTNVSATVYELFVQNMFMRPGSD